MARIHSPFLNRFHIALVATLLSGTALRGSEPVQISYELAKGQNVSINIYDASGQIVRELLHAAARPAGKQTENWDGRDEAGKPLPAGNYSWKMLSTPGFGVEFITNPGSNYVTDPNAEFWAQAPGCHGGPSAVAADADGFYVGASTENIETALLKQSIDGSRRIWSSKCPGAWEGFSALGLVGDTLWAYSPNYGNVYSYNKTTGAREGSLPGALNGEYPSDMAVNEANVILSYPKAGLVRWLDHMGKEVRSMSIPGASAVDVATDGTVLVISGSDMLKVAPQSVVTAPFLKNLSHPRRAAINPTNGDISILLGAPTNQVARYSAKGELRQTYGVAGGRVEGEYQSQKKSFRGAVDIAVTPTGNFWVAEGEAAPRRTAEFKSDGSWIAEWYGGQEWGPWITPEPDNPRYVWMGSSWGDMMRVDVDFAKKTWSVNACYTYDGKAGGLISGHYNAELWECAVHTGVLYLCRLGGLPTIIKVDRENLKITPVVVALGSDPAPDWMKKKKSEMQSQSMLWTDANGDGTPLNPDGSLQESELTFFKDGAAYSTNPAIDQNLNYDTAGGSTKFSVDSWNSEGAPIYKSFPGGEPSVNKSPRIGDYDDRWSDYVIRDASGIIWGAFNPDITGWGGSKEAFLTRWNPDGTQAWKVGRKGTTPGQFKTFRRIFGVMKSDSGDSCIVAGPFSYEWGADGVMPIYVYDQDGLYAGPLMGRPINQGATPNTKYGLGAEALSGKILRDAKGDVYLFSQWINEGRIYKITGWNDWQKAQGEIVVPANYTAPDSIPEVVGPSGKGTGLRGSYFTSKDCTGTPAMVRVDPKAEFSAADLGDYSVRWEGTITPRRTGWHMFHETKGWQMPHVFWVDGKDVSAIELNSEGWPVDSFAGPNHVIWLEAGKPYSFRAEYLRNYPSSSSVASDGIQLQWSEPETNANFTTIPASQLSPPNG